jgi:hypothetical protein
MMTLMGEIQKLLSRKEEQLRYERKKLENLLSSHPEIKYQQGRIAFLEEDVHDIENLLTKKGGN